MANRRSLLAHAGVAILFLISAGFEARFTYDSITAQLHATEYARPPFRIGAPSGAIVQVEPEAEQAGIAAGDRPVSIGSLPMRGNDAILEAVRDLRAGDVVRVTAARGGTQYSASVHLHAQRDTPLTVADWVLPLFRNYVAPWFCILLGFGVLFARPSDPLAWLLLLLMLSFSKFANAVFLPVAESWKGWMRSGAIFYESSLQRSWALWMLLFSQYFPNRVANRWWDRLARWLLGVPLLAISLIGAFVSVRAAADATAVSGIQHVLSHFSVEITVVSMIAANLLFVNMFLKMRSATPDDRRRLKLLYGGAVVSLGPMFFLFLATLLLGEPLRRMPEWALVPTFVLFFVFPVTLAYVIVVERAMELRVAVRQGLQYALASRSAHILQILATLLLLVIVADILARPGLQRFQQIALLGLALIILIWVRQVGERLRGWIDRRFFREAVDAERVLTDLSDEVRTIVEVEPLLRTVTETISSTLHVPRVAALVRKNGDFAAVQSLGYAPAELQMKFPVTSPVAERLEHSREPLRISLTRPDTWIDKNVEALGAELLLPLGVNDHLLGFLSLGPKRSEEPYSANDLRLLQSVAAQTGLALENSRLTQAVASEVAQRERLNHEMEIAREVQQRLLPQSMPPVPGLDYAGLCRPASSVGGDYYDFVAMRDGRLGIAVGDISGKGVPAALLMASLQASVRGLAITNPPALSTFMTNLNRLIYEATPPSHYATLFFGVYDPVSHRFDYVNAGHNPPMLIRGKEILRLEEGGTIVGALPDVKYCQGSVTLQSGDLLALFSDGITETMNSSDDEFDEERLIAALRSSSRLPPRQIIDRVMRACDQFAAGASQHDDMTLVLAQVK